MLHPLPRVTLLPLPPPRSPLCLQYLPQQDPVRGARAGTHAQRRNWGNRGTEAKGASQTQSQAALEAKHLPQNPGPCLLPGCRGVSALDPLLWWEMLTQDLTCLLLCSAWPPPQRWWSSCFCQHKRKLWSAGGPPASPLGLHQSQDQSQEETSVQDRHPGVLTCSPRGPRPRFLKLTLLMFGAK